MKKIIFSLSAFLSVFMSAQAQTDDTILKFENLENYNYEIKGDGLYLSNYTTMFYANGKIAYCIEPGVGITTSTYDSDNNFSKTNLTKKQSVYLEKLGYFGYEYPGHKTVKYYLATQELMWEYLRNVEVKFTTLKNGQGTEINLSKEKNEILNLINNYEKNPELEETIISIQKENKIKDINNVLSNYEIINSEINAKIENDYLIINSDIDKKIKLQLKYKKYDNQTTLVYSKGDSQKLATLRISNDKIINLELDFKSGTIEINKKGEKFIYEDNYYYEMNNLSNVKFGLYDLNDVLIHENITNENGNILLKGIPFGKYYIKEISNETGHKVDGKKYYINVNKDSLNHNITFNNYLPKGKLKLIKKGSTGELLDNVLFGLYTENGILITKQYTNKGVLELENLPFGKYYIKELKTNNGYILDNKKHYFEINSETEISELNLINDLIIEVPITGKNDILDFFRKIINFIENIF